MIVVGHRRYWCGVATVKQSIGGALERSCSICWLELWVLGMSYAYKNEKILSEITHAFDKMEKNIHRVSFKNLAPKACWFNFVKTSQLLFIICRRYCHSVMHQLSLISSICSLRHGVHMFWWTWGLCTARLAKFVCCIENWENLRRLTKFKVFYLLPVRGILWCLGIITSAALLEQL